MILKISDYICTTFKPVIDIILAGKGCEVVLSGGRGSTKSSVSIIGIILYVLTHKKSAIVLIKYRNGINTRLINGFIRYINLMGLSHLFKVVPSRSSIVLLENGQPTDIEILFSGCDDPEKLKSISPKRGSFGIMWIEEASNFKDSLEILNLVATFCRGTDTISIFSFNPPKSRKNWANTYFLEEKEGRIVHKSTYLDVIEDHPDWLGTRFIADAEHLKRTNSDLYNYMYLGIPTGSGGDVFPKVHTFKYKDMINTLGDLKYGLDFGHTNDPTTLIGCTYIAGINAVYICSELWINYPILDIRLAEQIKQNIKQPNYFIYADSASGSRIDTLGYNGCIVAGVSKPPGSVKRGIEWLSKCDIYIDADRCPNTFREFTGYEFKMVGGVQLDEYPDKDNHSIDAVRYALADIIASNNISSKITLI